MAEKTSCCGGAEKETKCDGNKSSACSKSSESSKGSARGKGDCSKSSVCSKGGCNKSSVHSERDCGKGCDCSKSSAVQAGVREYYGNELKTRGDCQSGINCLKTGRSLPRHIQQAFDLVHPDVTLRYFGCGPVIPEALDGCAVLDLGSGSGRDCFAVSKLIGPSGHVIGVDMTEEQLSYARGFIDHHMQTFGYSESNVEFRFGYIENLSDVGITDDTFDLVISNCVICLCQTKADILEQVFNVLKLGGEMYFSDMYTDKQVSDLVKSDHVMWGEGLGGAMQWTELYSLAGRLGFSRPRVVTATLVNTSKFDQFLDGAKFASVTYRLYKLPADLRPASMAVYTGGIEGFDDAFPLDHATVFTKDQGLLVDSELATILTSSRFSDYFRLEPALADSALRPETTDPMVDPILLATQLDSGLKKSCDAAE